jgi:hypothetical protein
MPKKVGEGDDQGKKFDLAEHRGKIIASFDRDETDQTIEIEGRIFKMRLQNLRNVDYVIVSPVKGFVPCANFILSEYQYRKEMERRQAPVEDRKPRKH